MNTSPKNPFNTVKLAKIVQQLDSEMIEFRTDLRRLRYDIELVESRDQFALTEAVERLQLEHRGFIKLMQSLAHKLEDSLSVVEAQQKMIDKLTLKYSQDTSFEQLALIHKVNACRVATFFSYGDDWHWRYGCVESSQGFPTFAEALTSWMKFISHSYQNLLMEESWADNVQYPQSESIG